ncbi:hypothetical protein D3C77_480090 [compost metagenome]
MYPQELNKDFVATLVCLADPEHPIPVRVSWHRSSSKKKKRKKSGHLEGPLAASILQDIGVEDSEDIDVEELGAAKNISQGANALFANVDSGWLQLTANANSRPVKLTFAFIEQIADRIHFNVGSLAQSLYFGQQIDSSRNGFLGFYSSVEDEVFWKIEPAGFYEGFGDLRPAFFLRDRKGYTVKAQSENGVTYLSTGGNGSPLLFTLNDYEVIEPPA